MNTLVKSGNSPPDKKLAVSPEMAVSVGSAKVRISPTRSKASSELEKDVNSPPPVFTKLFEPTNPELVPIAALLTSETVESPSWPIALKLTPICLVTERCISTIRTFRSTWSLPSTDIKLTISPGVSPPVDSSSHNAANFSILLAMAAFFTEPVSKILLLTACTSTVAVPACCEIRDFSPPVSLSTRISRLRSSCPSCP